MHDEPTKPQPDANADAATPVGTASDSAPGGVEFDPAALEQAAAQFTPSWDHIPAPDLPASEPRAVLGGYAPDELGALQGTGEIDSPHPVDVVVPRPPRAPRMDVGRLGHATDDDFGASTELVSVGSKASRTPWIAAAAAVFLATLGFGLWRSAQSPADRALAAPASAEVAPNPVPVVASPAPAPPSEVPPPREPEPTPAVSPETSRAAATLAPTPSPKRVDSGLTHPRREASSPEREHAGKRDRERADSSDKAKRREERAEHRPTSRPSGRKPKRGSGFVSVNPY